MGMCSTTQFMFMIRWSLLLVWPPKLLTPVFIYHSLRPLRTKPLLPSSSISALWASACILLAPQKSLRTPQTPQGTVSSVSMVQLLKLGYYLSMSAFQLGSDLQASKIWVIFSVYNCGSAQNINEWKIWVDDWVNERIISVYFKFSELTQAWDREES